MVLDGDDGVDAFFQSETAHVLRLSSGGNPASVHVRVTVSEMVGSTEIHTTTVPPNFGDGGWGMRMPLRVLLGGYGAGSRLGGGGFRKVLVATRTALLVMVDSRVPNLVTVMTRGGL